MTEHMRARLQSVVRNVRQGVGLISLSLRWESTKSSVGGGSKKSWTTSWTKILRHNSKI